MRIVVFNNNNNEHIKWVYRGDFINVKFNLPLTVLSMEVSRAFL